jgi:hypothetical protein
MDQLGFDVAQAAVELAVRAVFCRCSVSAENDRSLVVSRIPSFLSWELS